MANTLVNKVTTHGVTASSTTVSPAWSLAAGNAAIVMLAVSQGTSTVLNPTVADSLGNAYTLDSWYSNQITTGNLQVFLFRSPIAHPGGGDVITITFSASCQFWSTHVAEYNIGGAAMSLVVD